MRQVISKCFCLPPDVIHDLESEASDKRRSISSILTERLLILKDYLDPKKYTIKRKRVKRNPKNKQ